MNAQERNPEPNNPLGIDGTEFVEYATARPLALGALLDQMVFCRAKALVVGSGGRWPGVSSDAFRSLEAI